MGGLQAGLWIIFVAFYISLLIAGRIELVSGGCSDPGTPLHGSRQVSKGALTRFGPGTVIRYFCDSDYVLQGNKKIICQKSGTWFGKVPTCNAKGCPLPPPSIAHAHLLTDAVSNIKGSYIYYSCDYGYVASHSPTRLLCDKDRHSQAYFWNGTFSCHRVKCPRPPPPLNGHGNVTFTSLYYDSTPSYTGKATYTCFPGYILRIGVTLLRNDVISSCTASGTWSFPTPSCEKICRRVSDPEHGRISHVQWNYYIQSANNTDLLTAGARVTFMCSSRYRLQGSVIRTCLTDGSWSGREPQCVVDSCGSPGNFSYGISVTNNSMFTIWTKVTFQCHSGYHLKGVSSRQCLPSGAWTGEHNPQCEEVFCQDPGTSAHGLHMPRERTLYREGSEVVYSCSDGYYLWGEAEFVCKTVKNQLDWSPKDPDVECRSPTFFNDMCSYPPDCVTAAEYEERCKKKSGYHLKFLADVPSCLPVPTVTPSPTQGESELDKMTIVVATAGSTLGALVVLLTALVCVRRFHRSRRFRHSAFRSRRYSDDDRIAIIAAYTGDVHFILPSYDEAMSQVERSPPSFESVVQGQGENNQSSANNNNSSTADSTDIRARETSGGTARITEISDSPNVYEDGPSVIRGDAEEHSINIVNNPLAEPRSSTVRGETAGQGVTGVDNVTSDECTPGTDNPSSIQRSESLQSTSSDDDFATSQTQPLLGHTGRGVMV